jgi:tetratricopeptide (TPR) repeat protein
MTKDISVLSPIDDVSSIKSLKNNLEMLPKLDVFIWGFSSANLVQFPQGSPVENGRLSEESFLFHWDEIKINENKEWNKKPALNVNVFQFDGKYDLGFSGAPVCYNGNKKVIGIFTAKDNNYGYVIPIQTLLQKFNKNSEILVAQPNINTKKYLEKGNLFYDKKKFKDAIIQYDQIIKDVNYVSALNNKGLSLGNLGRYSEAIKWLDKALEIDPCSTYALNNKGWALHYLNRYEEAIECYDKALKNNANNVDILNLKGWALSRLGKHEEAIKWLNKALKIDPRYIQALNLKALSLNLLGRYCDAIKWLNKALKIDPNYTDVLNNKGWALNGLGRYSEAIKWLDKALEIDQNHKYASTNKKIAEHMLSKQVKQNK